MCNLWMTCENVHFGLKDAKMPNSNLWDPPGIIAFEKSLQQAIALW